MKVVEPPTPFGYTLFCDDIRHEVSGKITLVGIYLLDLIVPTFPTMLPLFHMRIFYKERPGESSEPVELRIYLPGDSDREPTLKSPVPLDQLRATAPEAQEQLKKEQEAMGEEPTGKVQLTGIFDVRFAPLELKKEGYIRVRAYRGDLEIKLGSLRVRQAASGPSTAVLPVQSQQVVDLPKPT